MCVHVIGTLNLGCALGALCVAMCAKNQVFVFNAPCNDNKGSVRPHCKQATRGPSKPGSNMHFQIVGCTQI